MANIIFPVITPQLDTPGLPTAAKVGMLEPSLFTCTPPILLIDKSICYYRIALLLDVRVWRQLHVAH